MNKCQQVMIILLTDALGLFLQEIETGDLGPLDMLAVSLNQNGVKFSQIDLIKILNRLYKILDGELLPVESSFPDKFRQSMGNVFADAASCLSKELNKKDIVISEHLQLQYGPERTLNSSDTLNIFLWFSLLEEGLIYADDMLFLLSQKDVHIRDIVHNYINYKKLN